MPVLDQCGIVYAGLGENLAQAGAARFLETPRGRVALVSFASTFTPTRARNPAGEAPGRPGVTPEMLESLTRIRGSLPNYRCDREDSDRVVVSGVTYKAGEKVGYTYEASLGNFIMDDLRTPVGADMFDAYDKDPGLTLTPRWQRDMQRLQDSRTRCSTRALSPSAGLSRTSLPNCGFIRSNSVTRRDWPAGVSQVSPPATS